MSTRQATFRDFTYIHSLAKKHADALGFLTTQTMGIYLDRGDVTIAQDNGDPVGYFLHSRLKEHTRIFQACVQLDAQGLAHGMALLQTTVSAAALSGTRVITLHCRDGLPSNAFWSACGFERDGCYPGGKSKGKIIHCWKLTLSKALSDASLPYAAAHLEQLARGQEGGCNPRAGRSLASDPSASWLEKTLASAAWQIAQEKTAVACP